MQNVVFAGRLAADPKVSRSEGGKARAVFRLLENRGVGADGRERTVGVNCVCWSTQLVEKVIEPGLGRGCEAMVVGAFVETSWEGRDGLRRRGKELVVERLTVLDWAAPSPSEAPVPQAA